MKFLLAAIHAKYIHTGLAVYSLRSYVGKELQEHVEVAEYTINQSMEDILADIYRRKADVVGFSCYIWNFSMVKRLVREFHKLRPEVPVWLGGPEVSFEYEKIFEDFPEVTGIMLGEGEETFRELLQAYVKAERDSTEKEEIKATGAEQDRTKANNREKDDTEKEAEESRENKHNINKNGVEKAFSELTPAIPGTATRNGFYGIREPLDMDRLPFYYETLSSCEEEAAKNKIIFHLKNIRIIFLRACNYGLFCAW